MSIAFALDPPPGIVSDDTTFAARGRWADASNVRFWNGRPQVIGGWEAFVTLAGGGECVAIFALGGGYTAYGCASKLWVQSGGGVPADRTPAGMPGAITHWSLAAYGATLLAAPQGGTLYTHAPGGGIATAIAPAPDAITAMLVTPQRQAMALGCNEEASGAFNPLCIRWSDIEDVTDWTTSACNNAGEHMLEGPGAIVGAALAGPYVAIWTRDALYLGQYVGDPGQSWRFERIAEGCGLAGPAAHAAYGGTIFWLSPDCRLFAWAPGALPASIPCPVHRSLAGNINPDAAHRIFLQALPGCGEIWLHYADLRDGTNGAATRYVAFAPAAGTWFRGAMTRTASAGPSDVTADYDAGAYLAANGLAVFVQGHGDTAAGAALNWHIESADQYLDEGQRRVMLTSMVPDFEDQVGDVSLTLKVRDRPQGAVTSKGPYALTTATTKKDVRASGRIIAARFAGGAASGGFARLGRPVFRGVALGER